MKEVFYFTGFVFFPVLSLYGQHGADTSIHHYKKYRDSSFIKSFDTVLHLQSWVSTNSMDYTLMYDKDFKLVLAPNQTNTLSFGFSYRYLDLGIGFSPRFMNSGQVRIKKVNRNSLE